jgi:hypothetical protein
MQHLTTPPHRPMANPYRLRRLRRSRTDGRTRPLLIPIRVAPLTAPITAVRKRTSRSGAGRVNPPCRLALPLYSIVQLALSNLKLLKLAG